MAVMVLTTTIQVNFVLIPGEAGIRQHKLTLIDVINFLPSTYTILQPFLGQSLIFTQAICNRAAPFLQTHCL